MEAFPVIRKVDYMGKDLKGKELGVGLFQRQDKRYSARFTNRYGRRMQFYHEKLSVVRKWLNDADINSRSFTL